MPSRPSSRSSRRSRASTISDAVVPPEYLALLAGRLKDEKENKPMRQRRLSYASSDSLRSVKSRTYEDADLQPPLRPRSRSESLAPIERPLSRLSTNNDVSGRNPPKSILKRSNSALRHKKSVSLDLPEDIELLSRVREFEDELESKGKSYVQAVTTSFLMTIIKIGNTEK